MLIAPYKGEVRELLGPQSVTESLGLRIDMITIEALLSGLEDGTSGVKENVLGGFLGLLTECPLVRGLSGTSVLRLLEDGAGYRLYI